ncbi:MAG: hypothetical protein WBA76_15120, partial [Phormidesmis sp.]
TLKKPLKGQFMSNTVPSSWGVLKRNGKIIAIAYIQSNQFPAADPYSPYSPPSPQHDTYHNGPDNLLSN